MADISSRLPTTDFADGVDGAVAPTQSIQIAGKDINGNLQSILTETSGAVDINIPTITTTGTLTSLASVVTASLSSSGSVNIDVSGPGFVGTITVLENTPSSARQLGLFNLNGSTIQANITVNGNYRVVGAPIAPTISVQFSSYTSGSATINIYASTSTYIVQPYSANAANVLVTSYLNDSSGNAIASINSQMETRDVLNVSSQYRAQSVTTTATEALGSATILANRKLLHITPTNGVIYWGYSSAVTTTTGTPLFPNNTLWLSVTDNVHVYVIAAATADSRVGEVS